ncbi:hypothetical protein Dtox_3702 [Desulfofarcimen acetoxidans DSM 771]|uniref:Uncharacterized protein n=1 Tax=Desulfofarcimen acetoxidans (strain ATCC 49208 / DSM 771 / KCTC 5769 / VKM B-1644 / 5575) TaxID=485916 RepID=C8VWP6_DESAS|nr:hypothetical protein Dtox_3702 [Desulfofarcimen acetoxidans DSM 771]
MIYINYLFNDILNQLTDYGVNITVNGGQVRLQMPWPPDQAPPDVRFLLRQLKTHASHIQSQPISLYAKNFYGGPNSLPAQEWQKLYQKTVTKIKHTKQQDEYSRLLIEALYYNNCYRFLTHKKGINPYKHVVENLIMS